MTDLSSLDATAQAELVRKKEVKPIELVEAAIGQIERLNPKINAVILPLFESAREQAKGLLPEGPFKGVPFLMKDMMTSVKGVPLTCGSALLKDYIPDHDSELTIRFRKAGLIILGKTNTPEYGLQPTTEPLLFGPTHNPWDLSRTPGGSSGGSCAAVASGMVAIAHANDGGGSIRIPASCCGVFGLKPTRARTPMGPDFGDILGGMVVDFAVSRSVRDSATLLDAVAGPSLGDPYFAPPIERPYTEEVKKPAGQLKIAFSTQSPTGVPVHQDCIDGVQKTVALLQELGHEVIETNLQIDAGMLAQAFLKVWVAGVACQFEDWKRRTGQWPSQDKIEPLTWALWEMGKEISSGQYLCAIEDFQLIGRQVAQQFSRFDAWLTPTLAEPPVSLGVLTSPPDDPLRGFFRAGEFCPFTPLCNITGQPAMSVPLYWNKDNLPIGSQFIAKFGDEATLFRLATQLEEASPWASKRPL